LELSESAFTISDFLDEYEGRILRRQLQAESQRYPLLLIDPLDEKIRAIGRGHFGIFYGAYSSGKSLFLVHVSMAYALQGLNVLYITLEDPQDVLENRMDSCMTGIPMSKLITLPKTFRKRFIRNRRTLRGRIHVVDATGGGCTLAKIEKVWEQEKAKGFIADAIVIDYDEELESEKKFSGEMARKREFEDIYKGLRRMAKRLNVYLWTASQTKRGTRNKRVLVGDDLAEDISKAKKAFLAIGIGQDPDNEHVKHLWVDRHRLDRSKFGVDVVTDFDSGIAYDREKTLRMMRLK
jgi:replicative DNA helicase